MRYTLSFLLSFLWLAQAAVIPDLAARAADLETRAANGYKSVTYFVNWVSDPNIRTKLS